jgi:hypothetical protein
VALGEQELHTVSEQLGSPVFNGTGTAYRFRTARFPRFLVEQELLTISEQLGSPVFTGTGTAYCFRTAGFPGFSGTGTAYRYRTGEPSCSETESSSCSTKDLGTQLF